MAEVFEGVFSDEVVSLIRRFNSHPVADIIKNIDDVYVNELRIKYKTYNDYSLAYNNKNIHKADELLDYYRKYKDVPAKYKYNRIELLKYIKEHEDYGLINTRSFIVIKPENQKMSFDYVEKITTAYRANAIKHYEYNEIEEIRKLENQLIFDDENKAEIEYKTALIKYNILTSKEKLLLWLGYQNIYCDAPCGGMKKIMKMDLRYILLKQYLNYNLKYYQFITPRKKYDNPHMNYVYNYPKKKVVKEEKAPKAYKSITNEYFN